jgi:hypothetical protein
MARFQCSEEEAVIRLQNIWNNAGARRSPSPPPPPPPPPAPPIPGVLEEQNLPPPARKKITFTDFELDSSIPETLPFFPAQFALDKIKNMEYVELWYFTSEGIHDASKITPTAVDDTFGLLRTDTGLALQQIKASKASHNVLCDELLSWEQIATARHNILDAASSWPNKHREVLAEFFMNLESLKATGSNPRALISYQATARRQWHTTERRWPTLQSITHKHHATNKAREQKQRHRPREAREKGEFYFPHPVRSNN